MSLETERFKHSMEFWTELYGEGLSLPATIWNELFDYYNMMLNYGDVLSYVTGNKVSKLNTSVDTIKAFVDDHINDVVDCNFLDDYMVILGEAGIDYPDEVTSDDLRTLIIENLARLRELEE